VEGGLRILPSPRPFRLETLMKPALPARVLAVLLCALFATEVTSSSEAVAQDRGNTPELKEMEVATVGVDLSTGSPLALLHSDWNELLPIWIGDAEAGAIARELQGVVTPRPMTHDLLVSVIADMGGTLEEVRVYEVRESTYIGMLVIRMGEGQDAPIREVDSRPSDALALAVRTGARLRVNPDLLEAVPEVNFISTEEDRPIVRMRGVTVSDPSEEYRERFSLPDREGVVVLHATQEIGSRGIEQGDLIVEVEGTRVRGAMEYLEEVRRVTASSHVRVRLIRNGEEREGELLPPRGPGRVGP